MKTIIEHASGACGLTGAGVWLGRWSPNLDRLASCDRDRHAAIAPVASVRPLASWRRPQRRDTLARRGAQKRQAGLYRTDDEDLLARSQGTGG
jgi:hypothetical protein